MLLACIGLGSCNRFQKQKIQEENPVISQCYEAVYEKDTVELKVNTLKSGKLTGDMVMKIVDIPKKWLGKLLGNSIETPYLFLLLLFMEQIKN